MRVDRDRDRDRDREQEQVQVRKVRIVEQDYREHDRSETARAEPTEERRCRTPRTGSEQCKRYRQHPDDGETQNGVEDDLPGHLVEDRAEDHGSEHDEGPSVEELTAFVDEIRDLAARVTAQRAKEEAAGKRGDEDASAERACDADG